MCYNLYLTAKSKETYSSLKLLIAPCSNIVNKFLLNQLNCFSKEASDVVGTKNNLGELI